MNTFWISNAFKDKFPACLAQVYGCHLGSKVLCLWTADGSGGHCWSAGWQNMTGSGCTWLQVEWRNNFSSLNDSTSQRQRIVLNKRGLIQSWSPLKDQFRFLRSIPIFDSHISWFSYFILYSPGLFFFHALCCSVSFYSLIMPTKSHSVYRWSFPR